MHTVLENLVAAGAIGQLCRHHCRVASKPDAWDIVKLTAYRDFREIDPHVIDQLVEKAKQARNAAELHSRLTANGRLRNCDIPSKGCE